MDALPGGHTAMVIDEQTLAELDTAQLRQVTSQRLLGELRHQRALNEKLVYENAWLKRLKFAAQSERHNAQQRSLLEEEIDSDLAAVAQEIEQPGAPPPSGHPPTGSNPNATAARLPATARDSPRTRVHHVRLWLPDEAHRRGRGREAGLRAGRLHGGAPRPGQMGLRQVRDHHTSAGGRPRHRQRHPHHRLAGPGAGGQVSPITNPLPPGSILVALVWLSPIHPGAMGGHLRRALCSRWSMPSKTEMLSTACACR